MGRTVLIGAGVMGSSVAFWLSEYGHDVHIVEHGYPGAGASGASFAWVNANGKSPDHYHDLNVAGMKAHLSLADRLGTDCWIAGRGHIGLWTGPDAHEHADRKISRLQEKGYAAIAMTRAGLAKRLPELSLPNGLECAVVEYPDEFWIDPTVYIATLLTHAKRNGTRVTLGQRVEELALSAPGNVSGVKLSDGTLIEADLVVDCSGGALARLSQQFSISVRMASTQGLLVYTRAAPLSLDTIVLIDGMEIRPDGGGRILLHDHTIDRQVTTEAQFEPLAQKLLRAARHYLPALSNVGIESWRAPIRPVSGDGLPIIGRLEGISSYYLAGTHSGITLAPHLGALVAADINGQAPIALAPYRPERLLTRL